jgi:hypothetical protein
VPRNGRDRIASKSVLSIAVLQNVDRLGVTWLISLASGSICGRAHQLRSR